MEASAVAAETTERANELYWESDRSVNQIADDLDLSKGALYGLIEPLKAGLGCPLCGAEVVFPNRTSRDRGRLDCPTCEWDGSESETTSYESDDDPGHQGADAQLAPPLPQSVSDSRMRSIAGGALLGAAVGLALVMWARRR